MDDAKLTELLRRARGDAERAANIYIDTHPPPISATPRPAAPSPKPRSLGRLDDARQAAEDVLSPGWRLYLGVIYLSAYTTKPAGHSLVKIGTPLVLTRPPRPRTLAKGAPQNTIVRIASSHESLAALGEFGRLPSAACAVMGPLMDLGAIEVDAKVCAQPIRSRTRSALLSPLEHTNTHRDGKLSAGLPPALGNRHLRVVLGLRL